MHALLLVLGILMTQSASDAQIFADALAEVDLTIDEMKIQSSDLRFFAGDIYRLDLFDNLMAEPLTIPDYLEVSEQRAQNVAGSPSGLLLFATGKIGTSVRRGLIGDPLGSLKTAAHREGSLLDALVEVHQSSGAELDSDQKAEISKKLASIPADVKEQVALLILASVGANEWLDDAFLEVSSFERTGARSVACSYVAYEETLPRDMEREIYELAGKVDFHYLSTGAMDLAIAVEHVASELEQMEIEDFETVRISTPMGQIVIGGPGSDEHKNATPFVIIDVGGNDVYSSAGATSAVVPVSVAIDLSGDDTYASVDSLNASFGSGVLGCGYLIDVSGDDHYRGANLSQGAGFFGLGLLIDKSGDDTYVSFATSQGAGLFGAGVLCDSQGSDSYKSYQQSQGFGFVKGCGVLLDASGNDTYVANDEDILFPAPQSREHNASLCQGVGFGLRADFVDGHSLAGGVGMLVDGEGNDQYSCGIFGQGCAYWYGVGMLSDLGGDDAYNGIWYCQGSAAHFALGVLKDNSGNDVYTATMNMAQGAGHDLSLGFLIDSEGDDEYNAPNLSLGGGNANGIGLFWDASGDDNYIVEAQTTLGRANVGSRGGMRDHMLCLGLFVDGGGVDEYSKEFAGNGKKWTQQGRNTDQPIEVEKGVGVDR
jgi:hypothetical protein